MYIVDSTISKNNKRGLLISAYKQFLSRQEINLLSLYMVLFTIFALDIVPKDLLLMIITIVFSIASLKCSLIMYLFFTLWESVSVFSFGITLAVVFQVVITLKILLNSIRTNRPIFSSFSDIFFLLFIIFYGIMDFLIGAGSLSGIGIGFDVFIALYAFSLYRNGNLSEHFWKAVFFTLMVSTFIAAFYGIMNDTAYDRWISGMGYVKQLYGTIGTARMGMYLCASLIYPVFYINNSFIKSALIFILNICAILTFSITTLICLFVFWIIVILFKDRNITKKSLKKLFIIVGCLLVIIPSWDIISNIGFIEPMSVRVEGLITSLQEGDISAATSSRSNLTENYIEDFSDFTLLNKFIGSFYVNRISMVFSGSNAYSHNTFIDILLYTGLFGLTFFILKVITRIIILKGRKEFLPVLLLKVMFLMTGLSVSMFTGSYWIIWMVL